MYNVTIINDGDSAVIETDREHRSEVAGILLDLVDDKAEVRTVTHVRGGLGFRIPARYRDKAHTALVADLGEEDTDPADTAEETAEETPEDTAPARNADREEWAAFLTAEGISYPEDAGRNKLIEIWDTHEGTTDDGANE